MGAASYLEDIIDRRGGGFSERDKTSLPPGMFLVAPPKKSGWVRLVHRDGVPLGDRFVPVVGEEITGQIEREKPSLSWEIEIEPREHQSRPTPLISHEEYSVTFKGTGLYDLRLICGAYIKRYEVEVVAQADLDSIPAVMDAYHLLIENPDEWTEDTMRKFLDDIDQDRSAGIIPRSFSDGLFEYHLALYLADRNVESSHRRFEEAYRKLRPYAGLSTVAQFAADYILFRKNTFAGHGEGPQTTRFGGLRQFFVREYKEWLTAQKEPEDLTRSGQVSVLLLPVDQLCLRAIQGIKDKDKGVMQDRIPELAALPMSEDGAERLRVTLVLARGYRFLGERKAAKKYYDQLCHISEESSMWVKEARQF